MRFLPRPRLLLPIVIPVLALGYLIFLTTARLHRVDAVTNLVETHLVPDPASPTGYAGGMRNLIVPGHNNESYQWILQTQQMLGENGPWRLREIGYDNAPIGRTVRTPSPYRWWLGLVAQVEHRLTGRPIGIAAERAARLADPALHFVFLVLATAFVAWRFGRWPAGLLALALATLFPFGGMFLPGQPGDGSLFAVFISSSGLLLLAGVAPLLTRPIPIAGQSSERNRPHVGFFVAAGIAGGLGFWVDAIRSVPVLIGIGAAGLVTVWCARRAVRAGETPLLLPWRHWAIGGALTSLLAYVLEYSPSHLGTWHLAEVHPLYAVAWAGLGELLMSLNRCVSGASWRDRRSLAGFTAAVVGMAAVPVTLVLTDESLLFTIDPNTTRLTNLVGGPIAQHLWGWLAHEGITLPVLATCLPLLLLAAAGLLWIRWTTDQSSRVLLALGAVPALVLFGFSCFRLRGWNEFDAVSLGLLVTVTASLPHAFRSRNVRAAVITGALLALTPGALLLTREAWADRHDPATPLEVTGLIERDLAHWLGRQAGTDDAVVFAPPNLTTSLIFHGGLAGIGTPFWENKPGYVASMRIAGASSPDEAHALVQKRNLAYIVMPSWDNFLEDYARQGAADPEHTLIALLKQWLPPRWLRPIPYHLPAGAGFESESVALFRVVDVQDNATALSYLAEYFVEMGMARESLAVAQALQESYPGDLSAAIARTLVARAAGAETAFQSAFADLQAALERGESEFLSWDRRVSLTIALVDGRERDKAREELQRCLAEVDESQLRSLTTISLHRFLVLSRAFGLKIEDPQLNTLAWQLLPAELREQR